MLSTRKTQGWSADHAKIYSLRSAKALPSAGNAGLVGRPCENLLPALRESLAKCEKCGAGRVFPPKVPIFAKNALKDVLM